MGLDLYILAFRFWDGRSGKSYKCRRYLCGRYTDHYVDEVKDYEWWLHGYRIAKYEDGVLTLDVHGWHTLMTMTRMNYVLNKGSFYVELRHGKLTLVDDSKRPRECYPMLRPIKIHVETGRVIEGPMPLYLINRTGRTKVSVSDDLVFVVTRVDPELVRKISGPYDVVGDGRVTLTIGVGVPGVYLRPAGWYRDLWFKVPEEYVADLIESVPDEDGWIFENIFRGGKLVAETAALFSYLLR